MGRRSFGRPGFLAEVNDETVIVVQLGTAARDYLTAARTAGTDSEGHE